MFNMNKVNRVEEEYCSDFRRMSIYLIFRYQPYCLGAMVYLLSIDSLRKDCTFDVERLLRFFFHLKYYDFVFRTSFHNRLINLFKEEAISYFQYLTLTGMIFFSSNSKLIKSVFFLTISLIRSSVLITRLLLIRR